MVGIAILSIATFFLIYKYLNYKTRQTRLEYKIKISLLEADRKKAEYENEVAEQENEKVRYEKETLINEKDKEMNEKRIPFFYKFPARI